MGKKVLILGVAAVQMDAVSQLKKMGCETFTCAMAKDGPAADLSDHFNLINILDEEKLATFIVDNKIDVVYSTGSDLAMPVACRLSERLGLPHFVSSYAANVCNHKNLMRERLTLECEGNIPFQVLDSIDKIAIQYPAILKPSDAQGQRGIFLIRSQSEFESHFQDVVKYSREARTMGYVDLEGHHIYNIKGFYEQVGGRNGVTEYYMYDATNIRLRELSLGYTLPKRLLGRKQFLKKAELSFVARNLFFIYKKAPFDPDAVLSASNSNQGIDIFGIPTTRSVGFNVKLSF